MKVLCPVLLVFKIIFLSAVRFSLVTKNIILKLLKYKTPDALWQYTHVRSLDAPCDVLEGGQLAESDHGLDLLGRQAGHGAHARPLQGHLLVAQEVRELFVVGGLPNKTKLHVTNN